MPSKRILFLLAATFAAGLAGFALVKTTMAPKPVAQTLPALNFTADDGTTFTEANLNGKTSLVFFGFTDCPDMCPATLGILSEALDGVSDNILKETQILFVTVNSEQDTPAVMTEYISHFHANIVGLTGDAANTDLFVNAVSAYAQKQGETASGVMDIRHSGDTYVINKSRQFVGKFPYGVSPAIIQDYLKNNR